MDHGTFAWRKSRYSGTDDNCVEVATIPDGGRAVRDSKNPIGPMLTFTLDGWDAFINDLKTGRSANP
ncbi:hypothetical protein GCM10022226_07110 [Sphaerisporangium flaviroseum]|uniref:DUF397 domain-containing protein n=1 Tax=Sphaerisporangium flaviroseum TaxID=509199 RepID=A0ABP7HJV5_9ACTN